MTTAHIKMVATDLDGTLLHSDGSVSDRTRAALRAAADAVVGRNEDDAVALVIESLLSP